MSVCTIPTAAVLAAVIIGGLLLLALVANAIYGYTIERDLRRSERRWQRDMRWLIVNMERAASAASREQQP